MKYTAIYLESWVSGSHNHSLVKMRRIEKSNDETMADMLDREGINDDIQFLFVGHPQLVGEDEERKEPEDTEIKCVLRGGSWLHGPWRLRWAARLRLPPRLWSDGGGFRLAMD